jgi:hypothetical protein
VALPVRAVLLIDPKADLSRQPSTPNKTLLMKKIGRLHRPAIFDQNGQDLPEIRNWKWKHSK